MAIKVIKDGEEYGPYELEDLKGYVSQGSFSVSDLCWQEGWEEWRSISTIISRPPPPAPTSGIVSVEPVKSQRVSNTKEEEKILWQGHANMWKYAGQFFWSIVLGTIIGIVTIGIGFIILPFWWWAIYAEWKRRKYIVTNKRVKMEYGLLSKSTKEVRIRDIKAVNVIRKGISGLAGIGTVEFSSAGGAGVEVAFEAIENAQKIKDMVNELQD